MYIDRTTPTKSDEKTEKVVTLPLYTNIKKKHQHCINCQLPMAAEQKRYKEFGTAARNGDLETIQRMLTGENPVPVDCLSCIFENKDDVEFLATPLVQACQWGHLAIVQELIRAGADIHWKGRYFTALHVACDYGKSPEVVETLLAAGADVNTTVANGKAPLICLLCCKARITMAQQQTIARLLLAAKCDVNQESEVGYTALSRVQALS